MPVKNRSWVTVAVQVVTAVDLGIRLYKENAWTTMLVLPLDSFTFKLLSTQGLCDLLLLAGPMSSVDHVL